MNRLFTLPVMAMAFFAMGLAPSRMICGAEPPNRSNADYLQRRGIRRGGTTRTPVRILQGLYGRRVVVGNQPNGYGSVLEWDRKDKEIVVVLYINAADDLGPAILNLRRGDRVDVMSADGWASFSKSNGKLIESIIGIAATGASAGAAALGAPEASPFIQAGAKFASDNFAKSSDSEVRSAYGKDQGGEMKRQEGGVLICMPEAGGVFYSGNDRKQWIQGKDGGERTDDRQPHHMKGHGAFFPIQGNSKQNARTARADGILHLVAWDFEYSDNSGYYRVILRITRGD